MICISAKQARRQSRGGKRTTEQRKGSGLTNDIGEQQCQGHCDSSGTQSCALPVATPVRFAKSEGRSGKGTSRKRPRRWRVNSIGC